MSLQTKLFQELSLLYPNKKINLQTDIKNVTLFIDDKQVAKDHPENNLFLLMEYILLCYKKKIVNLYEEIYDEHVLEYELTYDYTSKFFETCIYSKLFINNYCVTELISLDENFYITMVKEYYNKLLKYQKTKKNVKNFKSFENDLITLLHKNSETKETFIYNGQIPEDLMKKYNLEKMIVMDQTFYIFKE